jgi:hypothetical protein
MTSSAPQTLDRGFESQSRQLFMYAFKSKSKLSYDRRSVGQSVLVSGHHQGPWPIFLLLDIFFGQLQICYFVAPSLTRGRVCNLVLLQCLASAGLWSESHGTQDYVIIQFLRLLPTWRARSPYLYPKKQGGPVIPPRHWVPFLSPLTTRRATVEVF